MPSLAELSDYYPQTDNSLPVEQPIPTDIPRVYINTNTNIAPDLSKPITDNKPQSTDTPAFAEFNEKAGNKLDQIIGRLTGTGGEERYQTWPEKVVREALAAPHDAMNSETPVTSQDLIAPAQAVSALAGTGGLAGADASLGSTAFLRPALKFDGKIYKAPVGGQHLDALPKHLASDFQEKAMAGEDINHYNFGFMNHKGQFLSREAALDYAVKEGLVDPSAGQYGALTSTLMADSSKPGTAIEAMAKTGSPFYSALEHNIGQISQSKMTGDQWLGTLANKPGVKSEELDWTGVKDFLKEKGNQPVTKSELQEHLQNNKVEIKDVDKGQSDYHSLHYKNDLEHQLRMFDSILPEFKSEADIATARQHNQQFKETVKGYTNTRIWNAIQEAKKPLDFPEGLFKRYDTEAEAEAARKAAGADEHLDITKHQAYSDTKYHSYQLPGGENYREKLLTLPGEKDIGSLITKRQANDTRIEELRDQMRGTSGTNEIRAEIRSLQLKNDILNGSIKDAKSETYKSSHWDEPNILAHVRMNDRMIDGKKSLGINEAQSDWHQSGRKEGYKTGDAKALQDKLATKIDEQRKFLNGRDRSELSSTDYAKNEKLSQEIGDINTEAYTAKYGVPDAPFKKTWHELVLKRMIREAAEKGYDNLHFPGSPETVAKVEGWSDFKTKTVEGEKRYFTGDQDVTPIVNRYLVDFPRFLNKIGKEHGVKVEQHNFNIREKGAAPSDFSQGVLNHIDIPESLKNTAMHKGFPLFSNKYMFVPVQGDPFSDKK